MCAHVPGAGTGTLVPILMRQPPAYLTIPVMAGPIPDTFIDQLMARVDIVSVIDQRIPLTQKGKEFMACCPFHEEKTPSFSVSQVKQFYHCFGCGAHGTAIGFLMNYENLGFVEAVTTLANSIGLEVPGAGSGPRDGAAIQRSRSLQDMMDRANAWFRKQLETHKGSWLARGYLKERGLDQETVESFGIGFAPEEWRGLVGELGKQQPDLDLLVEAGLAGRSEKGGSAAHRHYDRFRGRIIFPIENLQGRVVGFGGRIIGDGDPKYLNSPETPLFHKRTELYGLHRARRAIGQEKRCIIVEGYLDVIGLAQFGIGNAVATLGTATTREHVQRLFRVTADIVFCFDGDRAGRAAAEKAMQVVLPEMHDGRQASFLFLAEGEDPDTTIRKEGREGFQARLDQATPLPDLLLDTLTGQADMSRLDGQARLVSLARPLMAQLPEGAIRELIIGRLSTISNLPDSRLREDFARSDPLPDAPLKRSARLNRGQITPVAMAISMVLQNPSLAGEVSDIESLAELDLPGARILLELLERCSDRPGQNTANLLEAYRGSDSHGYLEELAARSNYIAESALKTQFSDTLDVLREEPSRQRRLQLLEKSRLGPLRQEERQELLMLLRQRAGKTVRR